MENDFFQRMITEATEDLASGKKGWREADTNTLLLACFGMLSNHMMTRILKPLWFFASCVGAGVVWYVVSKVLGLG